MDEFWSILRLREQQEIVRRVANLFALAEQLEQRLAQAHRQVESRLDTSSGLRPPSPAGILGFTGLGERTMFEPPSR
jgi:hypothetical protein